MTITITIHVRLYLHSTEWLFKYFTKCCHAMVFTHRGQDRRFQDDQWHFGPFSIVSEALNFHHVELILSIGPQTHLEKAAQPTLYNTSSKSWDHQADFTPEALHLSMFPLTDFGFLLFSWKTFASGKMSW